MTAFLFRAGSGTPGDITKPLNSVIETGFLYKPNIDTPVPTKFGAIVFPFQNTNLQSEFSIAQSIGSTPGASYYGILVRMAPSSAGSLDQSFGTGVPNVNNPQGIGVKGYFNVTVKPDIFSVVRGGQVYIRLVAVPGKDIGDLEPFLTVGESEELPGVFWSVDGYDANNVTEIHMR
jgi:hypothetical protein